MPTSTPHTQPALCLPRPHTLTHSPPPPLLQIRARKSAADAFSYDDDGLPEARPEPPVQRCHWDYVLVEMRWLATDFSGERLWKLAAARHAGKLAATQVRELAG